MLRLTIPNLKEKGAIMRVAFEFYRKSRDKQILEEGPGNVHFWIKEKSKMMPVVSLRENHLKNACYRFCRDVLRLPTNAYLRVIRCHYWNSPLRVSYWAWVPTSRDCYKCHAECARVP